MGNETYDCIVKMNQIIDRLAANTETQLRFFQRLQIKGLKRIFQERELLINELATVKNQLALLNSTDLTEEMMVMLRSNQEKQQRIIEASRQALQAAVNEQAKTKESLQRLRTKRIMQKRYSNTFLYQQGTRINIQG